jgi:hypothetical protein
MWIVLRAVSALPSVQLPSASTSPSTHFVCFCTFYSYIFVAIFVYNFYTHLWRYSGLYSAIATFSRPFSCTFSNIHAYIHLWTHRWRLYSTPTLICGCTAVSTVLQLHFRGHFVYIYVHPHLHSSRPITCLVFKVAKSAWLHFTHQTETSLFCGGSGFLAISVVIWYNN